MNGIEKITARIAADAEAENRLVREAAEQKCALIRAEYEKKAQEQHLAIVQEGANEDEQRASRINRTAMLEARKGLLAMKQQVVSEAFEMAKREIAALPEQDYIGFLAKQAGGAAITGQEELIMNDSDRARCGSKVVKAANEQLAARGMHGGLTLSDATRPMSGGLILKQGDIEVNCTTDTLLELSRGVLAAQVAEVLFEG